MTKLWSFLTWSIVLGNRRYGYDAATLADTFTSDEDRHQAENWQARFLTHSTFESGNAEFVSWKPAANPPEIRVRVRPDRISVADARVWGLWFYFAVNHRKGEPTKIIIENDGLKVYNLGNTQRFEDVATYEQCMMREVRWNGVPLDKADTTCKNAAAAAVKCPPHGAAHPFAYRVRYSYDRNTWYPLKTTEIVGNEIHVDVTPAHDVIYLALMEPHTPDNVISYISEIQSRKSVVDVAMIGESHYNLPIYMVQIGSASRDTSAPAVVDLSSASPPALNSLKPAVWAVARQHPGEVIGGYSAAGIIDLLTKPSPSEKALAEDLLDRFVFYVVPQINPDGAGQGNWRTNGAGHNQNRDWVNAQMDTTPEILYVQNQMDRKGVSFNIDLHMAAADKHVTVYWPNGIDVEDTAVPVTQEEGYLSTVERRLDDRGCPAQPEAKYYGLVDWWVQDVMRDSKTLNDAFDTSCVPRPAGIKWLLQGAVNPVSTSDLHANKLIYNTMRTTFDSAAKEHSNELWTGYDTVGTGAGMYKGLKPGYHPLYGDTWPQDRYGAVGITVEMPGVYSCEAYFNNGMKDEDSVFGSKHGRQVGAALMWGLHAVRDSVMPYEGIQFHANSVSYAVRKVASSSERRLKAGREVEFHHDALYRRFIDQRLASSVTFNDEDPENPILEVQGVTPLWRRHATCMHEGARCEIRSDDDVSDPHNIKVYLKPDEYSAYDDAVFMQSFSVTVDGLTPGRRARFEVVNGLDATWAAGYTMGKGQPVWFSHDRQTWWSVDNTVEGESSVVVEYTPYEPLVHIGYQPMYNYETYLNFLGHRQVNSSASLEQIGMSVQRRAIYRLTYGQHDPEKKKIWVIGRSHPGETQGSYFVYGFTDALDSDSPCARRVREEAVVHVVPALNVDGLANGYHRTNAMGSNLNRVWDFPSLQAAPEVHFVLGKMVEEGVSMMVDVHQDETTDDSFGVWYQTGNLFLDVVSEKLAAMYNTFNDAFVEASGGVFTGENMYGFPTEPDMPYYSDSSVVYRFKDGFGYTLEMPFRRTTTGGGRVWSPAQSIDLGASMLDAVCAILDELPVNQKADRELSYSFNVNGQTTGGEGGNSGLRMSIGALCLFLIALVV